MVRPRFWVFAFIILLFFMSCDVAHAIITMNVGFNLTDQNGNGIINVGDRLVVTANLTAQDGDNLNNVTEIKCVFNTAVSGAILEKTLTGTAAQRSYTYNFTEDTNVNYQAINNVTVTATTLSDAIINQFTLIDLCPPQPAEVLVEGRSNFNVDPINGSPIIRRDSTFRLSFTDSRGQTIPAAGTNGTSAFVNLGPIGGIAQLMLTRTGTAPNYSFTTGTLTASAFNEIENDNLTLTYTITDNVNPPRTGAFQNFKFDNKPPKPVDANTGFDTQKTMLTFGDNIILRAQVTQFGLGDFVNGVLTFTPTTGGIVTKTFNNMAIDGTPAQGGTVTWRETINVAADPDFNGKTGNLSVTYTFRDLAGNQATVTKTMPCDFRDRAYTTKIINADTTGDELTGSINRQSRFYFDITYTGDYSPPAETIVSVDLAQIGLGNVTFNRTGKIFRTNTFTAAECSTLEAPNLMLPYSINEGINDPITGNFAPIRFDNKAPIPVDANTGFETTKPSLTFGDNISIIAQVNEYGVGDTVKAELTFGAYNRTFEAMNFNGPANAGATVNWREIINSQTDPNFANKAGNISVKFTFKDQAGNEVILNKTIACDFREPQYTARIINADTGFQTNLINRNTRFYYEIEYTGDYSPPADAVLTVDLTLIGRGIVNYIRNAPTGKIFRTTIISASECSMVENPDVIFVYTINDNINPPIQGNNPSVRFDNKPPMPVTANTGFETDKTTLVYGDNIDLIAQVTNYGAGDFASVTLVLTDTEDIVTSRTISNMSLDGDAAVGGTVTWRNSIDPSLDLAFKAKAGSLKGIFEFIDNAGNVATITKNILVNFKLPEFVRTDASVLLPDGSDSPYTVATTSCLLQFEVELKEMPASGVTVTADLTPVAGPSDLELLHIGSNVFRGMYELPEGALDDVFNGPFVFVITAVDGNGQTVGEDTTPALAVDNVIPIISAVTITNTTLGKAANAPFLIGDTFAVSVEATRIESGKITVDLTAIDAALPAAELTLVTGNTYTYNGVVLNCKDAGVICDDSKQFTVRAYDTVRVGGANVPGHYITALTPSRKFDNEPPIVKTAGYSVKTAAGTVKDIFDPNVWVKVSDRVTLFVDVASTTATAFDGQKVQLTNGGLYSLSTSNFNISGNKYVMEFTVPANDYNLSYNEYVASFTYRVTDNDGNTAVDESFVATDSIYVYNFDQYPPDLSKITFEVAPTSSRPGIIQKGDRVDFTVTIDGLTDVATISVDTLILSTPTATPTLYLESTDGGITYTGSIDVVDGSQAEDYRFEAYIFDVAGNVSVKKDNTLYTIDCVAPEFVSHYFTIGKDNGDNPDGAVANIEDELWLVAEISDYADGAASATIYYDGVHIATSTFVYNSSMSMHVAKFVVKKPGIDKWPAMDGSPLASLTYDLTSLDIHGNTGVVVSGDSNNQADVSKNFVVRNVTPAIAFSGIALAPNNPVADKGGIPVYNLGDNLIASGTLSTDSLVSAAYLDLSALPGGPAKYYLTDINASSAASINPIDLVSEFGINVDYTQVNLHLNLIDKGGKIASASHALIVDTKRPSLTKATFDGTNIVVNISEKITGFDNTANWRLIGSTTAGVEDYIDLSSTTYADAAVVNNATFSIHLAKEGRRKLSTWAHMPLYLAVPSAGFTDESGNAVDAVAYYPLNLIDTSWREPAKISSITLEKSFGPAYTDDNLVMTFTFNREMDFSSLVGKPVTSTASHTEIALFVNPALTDAQIKSAPSYSHFYVFQKDDVFTDVSERTLQVTLCASGTYWVSRKLSDNTKNLMVAHRYTTENRRFVSDEFNRPMHYYGVSQRITVTDNRAAIPSLAREVTVVGEPLLDLTNRTLDIEFSEPVLLFKDEFTNNLADPYSLVLPVTRNVPVTDYINKIKIYYDLDKNSFITPSFTGLAATNDLASTTLRLGLSVDDIRNILTMYANNSGLPNWGVRIEADAFNTLWKTGNNQYADFIEPVPGSAASVDISFTAEDPMVACAVSDAPPLKEDKGNLKFEFELVPNKVTGIDVIVPFDKNVTPKAAIFRMPSAGTYVHLASATFNAWGTRTVNGVARDVVSFTVNDDFAGAPFDTASGAIKLVGLRNILKYEYNEQIAEKVYNISDRNISSETGFTNASQPLIIDTLAPEALAFSHETSGIGLSPANAGRYSFTYSETMDPAFTPTFYLATGPSRLYFTFVEWSDDNTTAVFKNNTAITPMTLNGFWSYFLSGGKDLASNDAQDKTGTVEVRSQVASIKTINLYTKQKNIDATNYVVDKPFNYDSLTDAKAEVGITYLVAPENLPHELRFYDASENLLGTTAIVSAVPGAMIATATFTDAELPASVLSGSPQVKLRVADRANNETADLKIITYDAFAPPLSKFELTGTASFTAGIYYTKSNDRNVTLISAFSPDEPVFATISNSPAATSTITLTKNYLNEYVATFGYGYPDGDYEIFISDMAGNLHTGVGSIKLHVDNTQPTVVSIVPNLIIGNTVAEGATFTVTFDEPIDPRITPTLALATSTAAISMKLIGFSDDFRVASYTNINAITSVMPSGYYYYRVEKGYDFSGNQLVYLNNSESFKINVQSSGPVAENKILSRQPGLFGSNICENLDVNLAENIAETGSVTVRLDYAGGRYNEPHGLLMYDASNSIVGAYELLNISGVSSIATISTLLPDGEYKFKLVDVLNNIGPELPQKLKVDSVAPLVSGFDFADTFGTFTNGIHYYSQALAATKNVTIDSTLDSMRLVASGVTLLMADVATFTTDVKLPAVNHVISWPPMALDEGIYNLMAADKAGNFAEDSVSGSIASVTVLVDNTAPSVVSAFISDSDGLPLGLSSLGYTATGSAYFALQMSESMSPAVAPEARLATSSYALSYVELEFVKWANASRAVYRNKKEIGENIKAGAYEFLVSSGSDYAGNSLIAVDYDNPLGATVDIYSQRPQFTAVFNSLQEDIYGAEVLVNQPFSDTVNPGIATLTVTYAEGHPYSTPHEIWVYDNNTVSATRVATASVDTATGKVTVDAALFGSPVTANSVPYYFKIVDDLGGMSAFSPVSLVYDNVSPTLSELSINKSFYNPDTGSGLTVYSTRSDGQADPLVLCFVVSATNAVAATHPLANGSQVISANWLKSLADDDYSLWVVDKAGNFGAAPAVNLKIDRAAPSIISVTAIPDPITSGPAGVATITVVFDETILNYPTLSLATTTQGISVPCTFVQFTDAGKTIAEFSVGQVKNDIPQGYYRCKIKASDETGNIRENEENFVLIQSRGPEVTAINFYSYQSTVASSASEVSVNKPFSFNVDDVLSMSVVFKNVPNPAQNYYLHIYDQSSNRAVATLTTEVGNKMATYTWFVDPLPANWSEPANTATFNVYVADDSGDSLYSRQWFVDNVRPVYQASTVAFTGGVNDAGSSSIYYNPTIQGNLGVSFGANDAGDLSMRLTGAVSTDTYSLAKSGNTYSGSFDGYHSRLVDSSRVMLADGVYDIALADAAGNIAVCPLPLIDAANNKTLYKMVIDTAAPIVDAYAMYLTVDGVVTQTVANAGFYAPAAGSLTVKLDMAAPLNKNDAWYIEILRKDTNTLYRKLPLTDLSAEGSFTYGIKWNGKDQNGNLVPNAAYTLRAVDFTGNRALDGSGDYITASVNVVTSDFTMTSAQQLASDSAVVYFNHPIADTAYVVEYKHENDALWTTVAATDITKETNSLTFKTSPSFKSGLYGIKVSGVTSIYGVAPQSDNISLTTDGDGPVIAAHSFTGINTQDKKSVLVTFNEPVKADSVSNVPTAFAATKTLAGVTTPLTVNTATYKTETSVLLTFAEDLMNSATYSVSAPLSRDLLGNLGSSTPRIFNGRDLTAPTVKISAFSNPMNSRDLIVVATTNETLVAPPTLHVEQTGYSAAAVTMKAHPTNSMAYMASISVQSNRSKFGSLRVTATDLAGNIGQASMQFFVGSVRANVASEVVSDDESVRLTFKADSLKVDSDIRLLERLLEKENEADQTIRSSLQDEFLAGANLRASALRPSKQDLSNSAELVPISPAYEITVPSENVAAGFDVAIKSPVATTTIGVGLFYQSGNTWKFVSAYKNADNAYAARIRSSQVFAIMRDIAPPTLTLDEKLDLTVPFTTSRPEFRGNIVDAGSGIDVTALEAVIDGKLIQKFTCNDDGNFVFVPLTPLEGGAHSIEIKGGDRTGNKVVSPSLRFEVVKELKVTQIVQYPNPARNNYMNIRFVTNRSDITEDNVKIRIYDVAGHRVRTIDTPPRKIGTTYDFRWDMLNGKGKRVANGVYFAKVEIRDPNNPAIKFKATLKLAVLR